MDSSCLRFFNQHDKLNLTPKDLRAIDEETNKKYKTGLACITKTDKATIIVNHDNKHNIEIKDNKTCQGKIGEHTLLQTKLMLKDPPKELFILHRLVKYRSHDKLVKLKTSNVNDLKPKIIERLSKLKSFKLGNTIDDPDYIRDDKKKDALEREKEETILNEIKALEWLFDVKICDFKKETRPNIHTIIDVIQLNNTRIAIIKLKEDREYTNHNFYRSNTYELNGTKVYFLVVTPENPRYNYCSPGREMLLSPYKDVWCSDEILGKVTYDELQVYTEEFQPTHEDGFLLVTPRMLNEVSTNLKLRLEAERRESAIRDKVDKIHNKAEKDYDKGKTIVVNNITYGQDHIIYGGTKITHNKIKDIVKSSYFLNQEEVTFGEIYFKIITSLFEIDTYHSYNNDRSEISLTGKESIYINKREIVVANNNNRLTINGVRISKEDMIPVLQEAINMNEEDYKKYLNKCGKLPLSYQHMIGEGYIKVLIDFNKTNDNAFSSGQSCKVKLAIPIKYDKSIYLNVNGWKKVSGRSNLIALEKQIDGSVWRTGAYEGRLQRMVRLLFRMLKDLKPSDLDNFLIKATKDAITLNKKIERERDKKINNSLIFLKKCVETVKAKKVENGYLVRGDSGYLYFINNEMSVSTVKDNKKDKYLCIVDDNNYRTEDWEKNDGVGQRLLMLSHDKKLANDIYENGDRIDKWWLNIMNENGTN